MPTAADSWRSFSSALLELVYPTKCPLCGLLAPSSPCETCAGEMAALDPTVVSETSSDLDYRAVAYDYTGRAAQAVRRLKYSRCTSLGPFMASRLAELASELALVPDLVVPVPIHWSRRYSRGFNQAELLASAMTCDAACLTRIRATRPQVGLSREQRFRNLDGAFRAAESVRGKSILLVDDVVTSGQTARECAKALKAKGAMEVGVLAFCGESEWH